MNNVEYEHDFREGNRIQNAIASAAGKASPLGAAMNQRELEEYVDVLEKLLQHRERLLNEIPPCPAHGAGCVPHAVEWVRAHLIGAGAAKNDNVDVVPNG